LLPLATRGEQGDYFPGIFWHHSAPFIACGASCLLFAKVGLFLMISENHISRPASAWNNARPRAGASRPQPTYLGFFLFFICLGSFFWFGWFSGGFVFFSFFSFFGFFSGFSVLKISNSSKFQFRINFKFE
jgi:hypothetical protein